MRRALLVLPLLAACARPSAMPAGVTPPALAAAESIYADARALADRAEVLEARGLAADDGTPVDSLVARAARGRVAALAQLDRAGSSGDARLRETLRAAVLRLPEGVPVVAAAAPTDTGDACRYDPATLARGPEGRVQLAYRIYTC